MRLGDNLRNWVPGLLFVGLLSVGGAGFAQAKPAIMPDAEIEANVLKALASAPELADQAITSTTVYGTVTLKGTVRDEASRDSAEKMVSNAAGVKKVVDELVVDSGAVAAGNGQPVQTAGTNPDLQSDGTIAASPASPDSQGQSAGSTTVQQ